MGYLHPDQMLAELTQSEWKDWVAFYEVRPFCTRSWELRLGQVTSWIVTLLGRLEKVPDRTDVFPEMKFEGYKSPEQKQAEAETQRTAEQAAHRNFFQMLCELKLAQKVGDETEQIGDECQLAS